MKNGAPGKPITALNLTDTTVKTMTNDPIHHASYVDDDGVKPIIYRHSTQGNYVAFKTDPSDEKLQSLHWSQFIKRFNRIENTFLKGRQDD